jgi:hypothetical protein
MFVSVHCAVVTRLADEVVRQVLLADLLLDLLFVAPCVAEHSEDAIVCLVARPNPNCHDTSTAHQSIWQQLQIEMILLDSATRKNEED